MSQAKTARKRRTDGWAAELPEEQQAQIADRMRKFPWYEVAKWAAEQFPGLRQPSRNALYRFAEWFREHEAEFLLRQRLRDRAALERELAEAGAPDPQKLAAVMGNDVVAARARGDEEAVARAVRLYSVAAGVAGDSAKLALDRQAEERQAGALALARERFEAAERRARQADHAEDVLKSDLTPEEKDRRYRQIFGMTA